MSATRINLFDVGSRWGIQRPWNQYPGDYMNYFGFDADAQECERLNKINKHKNIKYLPVVLSDLNHNETLYVTREPGRSSLLEPNAKCINKYYDWEGFEVLKEISVKTFTLNKVIEDNSLDIDFLKLDTQGSELKIIKGADKYFDKILGFEIEVEFIELYKEQPLFHKVDAFMTKKGFELFDLNRYWASRNNMDSNYSNRGQIVFADAIYFRKPSSFFSGNHINKDDLRTKHIKLISILILYGHHNAAKEYLYHKQSPLSESEKKIVEQLIHSISAYSAWHKTLFNNRLSKKLGVLFHCLGNLFSYRLKTSGWGTDYNTHDGRYSYHAPQNIVRLFGRK